MNLNTYQKESRKFAKYNIPTIYPVLGLAGEVGEVCEKIKKLIRDNNALSCINSEVHIEIDHDKKEQIKNELGDVLWYIANLAYDLGFELSDIAKNNIEKLNSRLERGVICGDGDER